MSRKIYGNCVFIEHWTPCTISKTILEAYQGSKVNCMESQPIVGSPFSTHLSKLQKQQTHVGVWDLKIGNCSSTAEVDKSII